MKQWLKGDEGAATNRLMDCPLALDLLHHDNDVVVDDNDDDDNYDDNDEDNDDDDDETMAKGRD